MATHTETPTTPTHVLNRLHDVEVVLQALIDKIADLEPGEGGGVTDPAWIEAAVAVGVQIYRSLFYYNDVVGDVSNRTMNVGRLNHWLSDARAWHIADRP